jgi:hypothetical protein
MWSIDIDDKSYTIQVFIRAGLIWHVGKGHSLPMSSDACPTAVFESRIFVGLKVLAKLGFYSADPIAGEALTLLSAFSRRLFELLNEAFKLTFPWPTSHRILHIP